MLRPVRNLHFMDLHVVDDEPAIHAMLRASLPDPARLRSYLTPAGFLEALDGLGPGVVLLDIAMPDMDGHAVHEAILERGADMAVVFLTGQGAAPDVVSAFHRGAADYVCKPFRRAELTAALDRAESRLAEMLRERVRRAHRERLARLSPRELEVLSRIGQGERSKVIAHELGLSARTVEMHRAHICDKLGTNTAGAVLLAAEAGLIVAAA